MTDGRCPFAVWRGDDGQHGYPQGATGQNRPVLVVDHIMAGHKSTLDNEAWRRANQVDVHFGIGDDGEASQYTNIFDAAWGNGVAGARSAGDTLGIERYDRSNRYLAALEEEGEWRSGPGFVYLYGRGGSLLNLSSISIEHDKFPGTPWTPAKTAASIEITRWCIEEVKRVRGYDMTAGGPDWLVGHFQIDGVNRPNCPGPNWPRAHILTELGEEDDMALSPEVQAKLELFLDRVATTRTQAPFHPEGKYIGIDVVLEVLRYLDAQHIPELKREIAAIKEMLATVPKISLSAADLRVVGEAAGEALAKKKWRAE